MGDYTGYKRLNKIFIKTRGGILIVPMKPKIKPLSSHVGGEKRKEITDLV